MRFESKSKKANVGGKDIAGRGRSQCKEREVGVELPRLRRSKKAGVTGVE